MTNNNHGALQESIDELLVMEKRIERKADELTEYNNKLHKKIELSMSNIDVAVSRFEQKVEHKILRLHNLTDIAHGGAISLAKHSKRWMVIFFGFVVIMAILTGVASWKLHGLVMQIAIGENLLKELDVKLSQTPEIVKYAGRDYIKIVKYSEVEFNEAKTKAEKEKWGSYAQVWYPKRP